MHAGKYRVGCTFAVCVVAIASGNTGHTKVKSPKLRTSSSLSLEQDGKERVFVCNAFVDDQPIMVSAEKGAHGSELAYKQCEHYDLDLQGGVPLLLQPAEADEAVDALSFKDAPTSEGCSGSNNTCVAIIHRRGRRSPKSVVQWLRVPHNSKQPEIATVDAYALAGDDVARGLAAAGIPGVNSAAVFRIEDKLNPLLELSRQVVASRTLSLGRVYSAAPGTYHLVLEDLKGSTMVAFEDIELAKGGQYIMMRVGEPGSPEYPEQLVFRALVEEPHHKSASRRYLLTCGTVLAIMAIFNLSC
jgi:hypothetical protein